MKTEQEIRDYLKLMQSQQRDSMTCCVGQTKAAVFVAEMTDERI